MLAIEFAIEFARALCIVLLSVLSFRCLKKKIQICHLEKINDVFFCAHIDRNKTHEDDIEGERNGGSCMIHDKRHSTKRIITAFMCRSHRKIAYRQGQYGGKIQSAAMTQGCKACLSIISSLTRQEKACSKTHIRERRVNWHSAKNLQHQAVVQTSVRFEQTSFERKQ